MRQLLLDISTQKTPSLKNFVTGKNEELLEQLGRMALRQSIEHFIYLWGNGAVGKTHLLEALTLHPPARYINPASDNSDFLYDPRITLYLLDDCDKLSAEKQIAAFTLFNEVRENRAFLVTTGATSPSHLSVRDDLKSRMSWGLAYRIHGLTDDEKMDALKKVAQLRGFSLSPDLLPYLITHYPRDMHSLIVMLNALDQYSLQTKRLITLPLLREMIQKNGNNDE